MANLRNNNDRNFNRGRKEEPFRINGLIKVTQVRLVGDNVTPGVYSIEDALTLAKEQELDLVEIATTAVPPVCKIIDYSKFKYEHKKKQKEIKANSVKVVVKEIRFGPNTDDHDFNFKLNHAKNFLSEGCKIKAYVHFVGRTIVFKERGEELLLRFAQGLEEVGKVEQMPKLEGKRMFLLVNPKAGLAKAADKKQEKPAQEKPKKPTTNKEEKDEQQD
ncbi:MAG: translation initiation factor IF-3 [Cytophagia bacterium]|nr:MAG: translation initiation factor IF-3 [Cytophagia bacterium]TAG41098.1 MAG: translation initiation factor IF-3 [Cytophagia bacterium]TAH31209.1 MAG: translation initiation factor IF-3 [Cytophagales bacterium]